MSSGLGSLIWDAGWGSTCFWGAWPSFFAVLSFALNSLFRWSYWDSSDSLSWGGQDYHIHNNFNFSSDTAQIHWQNGWYIPPTDLILWLHLRFLHPFQTKNSVSSSPSGFTLKSLSAFSPFHYRGLSCEGMVDLQLTRGETDSLMSVAG